MSVYLIRISTYRVLSKRKNGTEGMLIYTYVDILSTNKTKGMSTYLRDDNILRHRHTTRTEKTKF